ncbi:hypothetical protein PIB30_060663, partial [Stylosanthes scabra]|nr:hypothetical protein [Stylosanthes scabra]
VINKLKYHGVISEASISPSSGVNKDFYVPLFKSYPNLIDLVDYQFQNEEATVPDPDALVAKYNSLKELYTKEKLFAGYSAENKDWGTVSPIVFFLGAAEILNNEGAGFSIVYHNYYKPNSTHNHGCIIS